MKTKILFKKGLLHRDITLSDWCCVSWWLGTDIPGSRNVVMFHIPCNYDCKSLVNNQKISSLLFCYECWKLVKWPEFQIVFCLSFLDSILEPFFFFFPGWSPDEFDRLVRQVWSLAVHLLVMCNIVIFSWITRLYFSTGFSGCGFCKPCNAV